MPASYPRVRRLRSEPGLAAFSCRTASTLEFSLLVAISAANRKSTSPENTLVDLDLGVAHDPRPFVRFRLHVGGRRIGRTARRIEADRLQAFLHIRQVEDPCNLTIERVHYC